MVPCSYSLLKCIYISFTLVNPEMMGMAFRVIVRASFVAPEKNVHLHALLIKVGWVSKTGSPPCIFSRYFHTTYSPVPYCTRFAFFEVNIGFLIFIFWVFCDEENSYSYLLFTSTAFVSRARRSSPRLRKRCTH